MHRFIIAVLSIMVTVFLSAQTKHSKISAHHFNYKGFATTIEDDAQDENGNHLLVGEIRVIEEQEKKRDTVINKIFNLTQVYSRDRLGIIIVTDSNYNTIKIRRSFNGKKVIYDEASKQFFIGANFFDYIKVDDNSFSAWQPVIIKTNLELASEIYFLRKDYSCILQDMRLEKDRILLFTRSTNNEILKKRKEKVEVIAVSTENIKEDTTGARIKNFEALLTQESSFESGRVTITDVSKFNNSYYFATSTLDQFKLTNSIHLYEFKNDRIIEVKIFPKFIQYAMRYDGWMHLNNGYVDSKSNYYILVHKAATKEKITLIKTDTIFRQFAVKNIPLNDYAEMNDFLVLRNGNLVLLSINEKGNWSYYIYTDKMEFLQEIKTTLYRKYRPMRIKESGGNQLTCLFTVDMTTKNDCVVHRVDLR